jgi:hypothetical protein
MESGDCRGPIRACDGGLGFLSESELRLLSAHGHLGEMGPETAVAASARYEAYASIAYNRDGRIWVAYEEGGSG